MSVGQHACKSCAKQGPWKQVPTTASRSMPQHHKKGQGTAPACPPPPICFGPKSQFFRSFSIWSPKELTNASKTPPAAPKNRCCSCTCLGGWGWGGAPYPPPPTKRILGGGGCFGPLGCGPRMGPKRRYVAFSHVCRPTYNLCDIIGDFNVNKTGVEISKNFDPLNPVKDVSRVQKNRLVV